GGASRGEFVPPSENSAPGQAAGGASRGEFVPPSENSAPGQAAGGAARGDFMPSSDNGTPSRTVSGSARGDFMPPSDNGTPSQAAGGAARGDFTFPQNNIAPRSTVSGSYLFDDRELSLLALLPESFYGTTLSSHPTILAYIPASPANEAILSLKDEDKNMHYQMLVPLSGQAGIVAIALPDNAPPLEVDRNYQWYLAIKLDGNLSPSTPFIDGWVKRIEPSAELAQALEGQSLVQQSSILAANGVWYDSASILVDLRRENPTDPLLLKEWTELLDSVELSQFINAPL
ncbi:MAG: DUF928 domain-containing protein, partial [Spirulina sp.]